MAQTEGQITGKHVCFQISADGVTWTASLDGSISGVAPSGGDSMTGSTHTFEGHNPIIGIGKNEPVTLDVTFIYTEVGGEAADLIDGYKVNQDLCWIRYRPNCVSGNWEFVGKGYWTTAVTPTTDATTGDIVSGTATWFGGALERQSATT